MSKGRTGFNGDAEQIRIALGVIEHGITRRKSMISVTVKPQEVKTDSGSVRIRRETFRGKGSTVKRKVGRWKQDIGLAT